MVEDAHDLVGRIDAINPFDERALLVVNLHVVAGTVAGVSEVNPSTRVDREIVRRVEPAAVIVVR